MQNSINNVSYKKKSETEVIAELEKRGFDIVKGDRFVSLYFNPRGYEIDAIILRNDEIKFYRDIEGYDFISSVEVNVFGDLEEIRIKPKPIVIVIRRR